MAGDYEAARLPHQAACIRKPLAAMSGTRISLPTVVHMTAELKPDRLEMMNDLKMKARQDRLKTRAHQCSVPIHCRDASLGVVGVPQLRRGPRRRVKLPTGIELPLNLLPGGCDTRGRGGGVRGVRGVRRGGSSRAFHAPSSRRARVLCTAEARRCGLEDRWRYPALGSPQTR